MRRARFSNVFLLFDILDAVQNINTFWQAVEATGRTDIGSHDVVDMVGLQKLTLTDGRNLVDVCRDVGFANGTCFSVDRLLILHVFVGTGGGYLQLCSTLSAEGVRILIVVGEVLVGNGNRYHHTLAYGNGDTLEAYEFLDRTSDS